MLAPRGSPNRAAPMASAPFVRREDGRPDWRSMWTSFCDLALHGGPPHRGIEQALRDPWAAGADAASDPGMVAEIRRGIWETTGLFVEPQSPAWIAVSCESRAMAEWLGAAIVLENVTARVEDDRVLLPAGPRFRLEDEVKSIVTVVAKTHHYWAMHEIAARPDRPDDARGRCGFRCGSCGLDFQVSRPESAVDLDATCPVDGTRMARWDLVTARRSPSLWHAHGPRPVKVGVEGSADEKIRLIDALRRRYGRRRAVVASPARAIEVNDPAIDLVLVDVGEDGEASVFGPEMVDATIGVLNVPAVARALRRGDRGLDVWHLLVVGTGGEATVDLSRIEQDASRRRGRRPVAFVDLATGQGIDVIMSWLQRELRLEPWRERRDRETSRGATPCPTTC